MRCNKKDKEIRKLENLLLKCQHPLSMNCRKREHGTWTSRHYLRNSKFSLGIKYMTQNPQKDTPSKIFTTPGKD